MTSSDSAASNRPDSPLSTTDNGSSRQAVLAQRANTADEANGQHVDTNQSNGNGAHSNGTQSLPSGGESALNIADPRTQVLLEQLLTTLSHETAPEPEKSLKAPSISTYLGMMRRRWKPMLLIFLVTLAAVSWKLKPGEVQYITSATMLLPAADSGNAASAAAALLGAKDAPGGSIDTQIAIATSPEVLNDARYRAKLVLQQKGQPTAPVDDAEVKAAAPVSPELIDVTVTAKTSAAATTLANSIVVAFANYLSEKGNEVHTKNMNVVRDQVKTVGKQLEVAKADLQAYKDLTGVFSIETELVKNATQIQELEAKERAARIEAAAGATGETVLSDGITTTLQQKTAEARLRYETVLQDFLPTSPEARAAESAWRAAQKQVDSRVATLVSQTQQQARDAGRELNEARGSAAKLPRVEYNLSQKTATVGQLQDLYKTLTDRYTALTLTAKTESAAVSNLSKAVSAKPAVRTWSRALMTGLLCALVLALACAALLEQLDTSIHSVDDIEPLLQTPVLGSMPLLRGRAERRLAHITGAQPMAPVVLESCRIIRSNLAFATMDAPVRSVLITSADPGEGKSLSALNLATVMAFDGRSVVLVDCDLRRPSQHTLNGLPLEPGITNVLAGESTVEETLQSTSVKNLKVLTAGTLPLNPPELLGSRDTRQLLNTLKEMFDIVIIDSPPILALTDAQVLCSVADGVAMVVAADSTPRAHVQRAQGMLRRAGGRVLGVIFNKVKKYNNPDAYGGYYGQGNTYGNSIAGTEKQLGESVGGLSKRA
ncbi:MAG: hypothetical protein JWN98_1306 [Abditibacteriota bacterium]|nr:hypothetical protein [Abditibacteriota bacterium]